jgi:protein-disulfide isomerase/uncharacterized membrane protein
MAVKTGRDNMVSPGRFYLAILFVGFAAAMSFMLVLEHIVGMSLPGCGEGSACQDLANSFFGKIKIGSFAWPSAYLGFSYFLAILVSWIAIRGGAGRLFKYLVRFGALVSLGFTAIIVVKGTVCPYCLASHAGNLAFWLTVEGARVRLDRPMKFIVSYGLAFIVISMALGVWEAQNKAAIVARANKDLAVSTGEILNRINNQQSQSTNLVDVNQTGGSPDGFTGRWRVGPEDAPIRIVLFTDYQCQDCYRIEKQVVQIFDSRDDVSISIKHFPFNCDCNRFMTRQIHRNACWAARAAEAAGLLWGPDGFWAMHKWLFKQRGVFRNTQELEDAVAAMGFNPAGFNGMMTSAQTMQNVRADTEEAKRYGLHFTPMIFINGVELKGWNAPNALIRTVNRIGATNPPRQLPVYDNPPPALDKYIADFLEQKQLPMPANPNSWSRGADDPVVDVVMWGDYEESSTARANGIITEFAKNNPAVRYTWRHFPVNSDCNPKSPDKRHPNACRMALAAEAAGVLGGQEMYWRLHDWLIGHWETYSETAMLTAAVDMGLDRNELLAAMSRGDLFANIAGDIKAGDEFPSLRYGMPAGIYGVPAIFINGRFAVRWSLEGGEEVLTSLLRTAAKEGSDN